MEGRVVSAVKPALTAKEWADLHSKDDIGLWSPPPWASSHAIATYHLYEQPFGFTREDVQRHRDYAASLEGSLRIHRMAPIKGSNGIARIESERDWHVSIADRIEALLPPEES